MSQTIREIPNDLVNLYRQLCSKKDLPERINFAVQSQTLLNRANRVMGKNKKAQFGTITANVVSSKKVNLEDQVAATVFELQDAKSEFKEPWILVVFFSENDVQLKNIGLMILNE